LARVALARTLRRMETPPALPPTSRPPLGKKFAFILLGPVVAMALAAALSAGGKDLEGMAFGLSMISLLAMLVCSIICAVWVGRRQGSGLGFLTFLGIQVFYIAVAFAGCAALVGKMDFH
jgi:hypothetical protein